MTTDRALELAQAALHVQRRAGEVVNADEAVEAIAELQRLRDIEQKQREHSLGPLPVRRRW